MLTNIVQFSAGMKCQPKPYHEKTKPNMLSKQNLKTNPPSTKSPHIKMPKTPPQRQSPTLAEDVNNGPENNQKNRKKRTSKHLPSRKKNTKLTHPRSPSHRQSLRTGIWKNNSTPFYPIQPKC